MEWTNDKPTTPGYYAWKEQQANAGLIVCRRIAKIKEVDNKLMIDFNSEGTVRFVELDGVADRPWIKVGEINDR